MLSLPKHCLNVPDLAEFRGGNELTFGSRMPRRPQGGSFAMQKVVGSNPISRLRGSPANLGAIGEGARKLPSRLCARLRLDNRARRVFEQRPGVLGFDRDDLGVDPQHGSGRSYRLRP